MKTSERRRLKGNELASAIGQAQGWMTEHRSTIMATLAAIVVVGGAVGAFAAFRSNTDSKARTMLAEAMVIEEARVMPPAPPAGTTTDANALGGQLPGTYPTDKARLDAALPKFMAAADAYPTNDAGITARYHAAGTLVALGRFDEAAKQYDQVMSSGSSMIARMARLGKAEAQIRAGQYDPALATLKALSEQKDSGLPPDAVLMELARGYRLAGKVEDARKTLNQIVEQHADSPFATEAKTELEKLKS